jgi:hypothetical protein
MPKQILLSMCVTLGIWGFSALAQGEDVDVIQSCEITTSQAFKKSTIIECDGDLKIKDGLTITSEEGSLHILTAGQVFFGEGTRFLSSAKAPETIRILATTARGQLDITTSVDVEMEYASVAGDYQQLVKTQYGAEVRTFVSSQKLLLQGPEHNISRE